MIFVDFIRTIKRTFTRFLSILLMVALGVAFYAGVRSAEPDMNLTADALYDDTNFMDIRVVSTLGLTDADLDAVKEIPGVLRAETGMQTEVISTLGDTERVYQVFSVGNEINKLVLEGGRLPSGSGECFMDGFYFKQMGLQLGDKIVFRADADEDILDTLCTDTYEIVGYGTYPFYTTFDRGTSSIGNGSTDAYVGIPYSDFVQDDEDGNIYHNIYIAVEGAKELGCYDDDYEDLVEAVADRIEAIEDERCEVRYNTVMDRANGKIADAEAEIADAKVKIEDGKKELADAEDEYNEKVADAEAEIADNEKKLEDGKREYEDGVAELADKKKELAEAREKLQDGRKELDENEDKLAESRAEYEDGLKEYEAGYKEYEDGLAKYEAGYKEYQDGLAKYEAGRALYGAGVKELEEMAAQLEETRLQFETAKAQLDAVKKQLDESREQLEDAGIQLEDGEEQLREAGSDWQDGWNKLTDGEREIKKAEKELADAKIEIEDGEVKLAEGKQELADAKAEYTEKTTDAKADIADAEAEVADAEAKVADAKDEVADIDYPEWYVLTRNDSVQTYIEYGTDAERIGAVGKVFPAIFFIVAALVSLTTMTRMVEEERTQIGTLKALGYSKHTIAAKYIWYALLACIIGGVLGVAVGHILLPYVIVNAYKILYIALPKPIMPIHWKLAISSVAIAVLSTVLATVMACYGELSGVPAELMRPAAPKQGKRILLEKIGFIWKRMSFTWKSTSRNLFRYKKRLFMTMFGIGGCMALLMVGFGLRDSIMQIVDNQYKAIWTYDAYLSVEEGEDYDFILEDDRAEDMLLARLVTMDASTDGITKGVNLMIPERTEGLSEYLSLQDRVTGEKHTLTNDGVIISEKAAKILGVNVGDTFFLGDTESNRKSVKVAAVTENYLYHYVYMTKEYYEKTFGEELLYNQVMLQLKPMSEEEKSEFSSEMIKHDCVDTYMDVVTLEEKVSNMMHSLDLVIWVLIISAGLLAFVVLYNLNNISILERQRELATLKVLGFYDIEVAEYVYRENVILTVLGIAVGVVMGLILHQFVIQTCEIDMIMFGRRIKGMSYLYSVLLTFFFAILVNGSMFYRLRKVDMVESLKSAE